MQKLKFRAVEGLMVYIPGSVQVVGQAARFVGRVLKDGEYRIAEPFECAPEAEEARRLAKCARRGDVAPADKFTADFCGLPFADPEKKASK